MNERIYKKNQLKKKLNTSKYCSLCGLEQRELLRILPSGSKTYREKCRGCIERRGFLRQPFCEWCRFLPIDLCQLDLDHIDNDRSNWHPSNLQTLCANCHRLKTKQSNYNKGIIKYKTYKGIKLILIERDFD